MCLHSAFPLCSNSFWGPCLMCGTEREHIDFSQTGDQILIDRQGIFFEKCICDLVVWRTGCCGNHRISRNILHAHVGRQRCGDRVAACLPPALSIVGGGNAARFTGRARRRRRARVPGRFCPRLLRYRPGSQSVPQRIII